MFRELAAEAVRLRDKKGGLPPAAFKPKTPRWVIELTGEDFSLFGPYTKKDSLRELTAPDRQRSGTPGPTNLKPFLLLDKAIYSLGIGSENEPQLHKSFKSLICRAWRKTREPELGAILRLLSKKDFREKLSERLNELSRDKRGSLSIESEDLIAIRVGSERFPFELESVQSFWASYLGEELVTEAEATCLCCGLEKPVMRILTRELVIMGQKCQVTSFNKESFRSLGLPQTVNSPLCFNCTNDVIDALDYLIRSKRNRTELTRDESKSQSKSPLRNQLAVFWLSEDLPEIEGSFEISDPLTLLSGGVEDSEPGKPPPALSQIKDALEYPKSLRIRGLNALLDETKFYLGVLSANKGRMVVREWLSESVEAVLQRLNTYAEATNLIGAWGEPARPFTVKQLLYSLKTTDPNLSQSLLRTAYLGHLPPQDLLNTAVARVKTLWSKGKANDFQKEQQRLWNIQAALAAVKLVLTFEKREAKSMSELDKNRQTVSYLCGRLLAVLEEAQRRSSGQDINATIIDRFYSSVASAPSSHLTRLHNQAMKAHLPKLRRQGSGYSEISNLIGELMTAIGAQGGIPSILTLRQQGEFGVGYWSQRVVFRKRKSPEVKNTEGVRL